MKIRFLGTHNAESKNTRLVSFLVDEVVAIDAGSLVSELTFLEQAKIKAILLSHGHYDHIRAVPAFAFSNTDRITRIFGTTNTIQMLSSHFIDGIVYPEYTSETSVLGKATIKLVPIEPYTPAHIEGYKVTAIPVRHPLNAVGFEIISGDGGRLFYTGDTGPGLSTIWEHVSPQLLITDVTWSNRLTRVAEIAGHLCPEMLKKELIEFRRIKGYLPEIVTIHMSPQCETDIGRELEEVVGELNVSIKLAHEGEEFAL